MNQAAENIVRFGTKSETLERLQPRVIRSRILPLYFFTARQWRDAPADVLQNIARLEHGGFFVIVRSSAQNEDSVNSSMAGLFTSCLNVSVTDPQALSVAIEQVIASFAEHRCEDNQILIQPMLTSIQMSGVVMTHDLEHGAPYYVVNYDDESGLTDTITGGQGIQKTVLVYRDTESAQLRSPRLQAVIDACRELETLCGNVPLDIEFAVDHHQQVYVLQVRRITLCNTWHPVTERRVARQLEHIQRFLGKRLAPQAGLYGDSTLLGVMPDWNPAEIIGTTPRPLAVSLYRRLVTDSTWREARALMGYHQPRHQALMVMLGHHPYIDVRCSFNSFLPAGLEPGLCTRLVNAWLQRLQAHPQWHDKVEFEVVQTCLDFTFDADFAERYGDSLSAAEQRAYRSALDQLTLRALSGDGAGALPTLLDQVRAHERQQQRRRLDAIPADLDSIHRLLLDCREQGTLPFAMLARHAFIAEALLRSACRRGALSNERLLAWKQSIHTVTTELTREYAQVCADVRTLPAFVSKFGHLRPGTYDITSLRYDERHDLFAAATVELGHGESSQATFQLQPEERQALQQLIDEQGWPLSTEYLLDYASQAIQAREYAKLVFTRDLSDALQLLVSWGADVGLAREDLSFLDIHPLLDSLTTPLMDDTDRVLLESASQARRSYEQGISLKLGHLISAVDDVFVAPLHRSLPNFITRQNVEAVGMELRQDTPASAPLKGKIVCIENADPGYDWVFTRGIAGLVTQYGGANSHMAIRCAEFGIPAAIGCGEQLFNRILRSPRIALNCRDKTLNPVQP
ncbi:PEP/pyruvate-binding domain-containing protein [Pseudomonas chlororaphis]|uniref:PEP/pyruvate-binding domain-containing protein n=1 Tax=Pseudomonas chlororaphis TaxID=587753 RepID=UPI000F577031|nr:PEP/pyruvate-binding domain-containing protein [Pseudomonas chlororaphis]AZD82631.1 Phosphoenolpyruvate synthase [Pseudomonas chlororaphis subsp. aurantiaca]